MRRVMAWILLSVLLSFPCASVADEVPNGLPFTPQLTNDIGFTAEDWTRNASLRSLLPLLLGLGLREVDAAASETWLHALATFDCYVGLSPDAPGTLIAVAGVDNQLLVIAYDGAQAVYQCRTLEDTWDAVTFQSILHAYAKGTLLFYKKVSVNETAQAAALLTEVLETNGL